MEIDTDHPKVLIICLTGGPCAGKTTALNYLADHFENLNFKVYCVQESAEIIFSCGIKFDSMVGEQMNRFQENLIKTIISIENIYFNLSKRCKKNCIIICDRGIMDAFAYTPLEIRQKIMMKNDWKIFDIRDNRYDIVIHLVTAACNAEKFYKQTDIRKELPDEAKNLDLSVAKEWMGHPDYYIIDNSTNLEGKFKRAIHVISKRLCIQKDESDSKGSYSQIDGITIDLIELKKKPVKFIIACLPDDSEFPQYEEIDVVYHYLIPKKLNEIAMIRKRGRNNCYNYSHSVKQIKKSKDSKFQDVLKKRISHKKYLKLLSRKSPDHYAVFLKRRCFIWKGKLFHLDVYIEPKALKLENLIMLKCYSNLDDDNLLESMPTFLDISRDVSNDPKYLRYYLSSKKAVAEKEVISYLEPVYGHDELACD